MLYIPINRTVQGGVILSLPWDENVPFWPIWAVPYLLSILWWMASFIWAAWKMDDDRYRAFVAAALAVMLTAYAVYMLYPTYVERPALEGHSWQVELVRSIYSNDRLNNAFPSGHVYTTMLIALFWWDWRPKLRWLWARDRRRRHPVYPVHRPAQPARSDRGHPLGLCRLSLRLVVGKADASSAEGRVTVRRGRSLWLWSAVLVSVLPLGLALILIYSWLPADGATGNLESFRSDRL